MEDDLDKVRNHYKEVITWYRDGLENLSPVIERRELIKKVDASFSVFDHDHDVIRVMPAIHELQDFLEAEFSYLTKEDIDRVVPTIKKEGGYQFIRFRKLRGTSIYSNFHASRFHSAELWAAHTIVERIILLEEEISALEKDNISDDHIETLLSQNRLMRNGDGTYTPTKSIRDIIRYYLENDLPITPKYAERFFRNESGEKYKAIKKSVYLEKEIIDDMLE